MQCTLARAFKVGSRKDNSNQFLQWTDLLFLFGGIICIRNIYVRLRKLRLCTHTVNSLCNNFQVRRFGQLCIQTVFIFMSVLDLFYIRMHMNILRG